MGSVGNDDDTLEAGAGGAVGEHGRALGDGIAAGIDDKGRWKNRLGSGLRS